METQDVYKEGDVIQGGPFDGFEVIDTYTRAEALADGVLIDVTDTAREAGILFPTAVSAAVWGDVQPSAYDQQYWGQDVKGRLWDTLWLLCLAIKAAGSTDVINYDVRYRMHGHMCVKRLKAICGPGDNGQPVITIMKPEEG